MLYNVHEEEGVQSVHDEHEVHVDEDLRLFDVCLRAVFVHLQNAVVVDHDGGRVRNLASNAKTFSKFDEKCVNLQNSFL